LFLNPASTGGIHFWSRRRFFGGEFFYCFHAGNLFFENEHDGHHDNRTSRSLPARKGESPRRVRPGENLLIAATDRLSAFDVILPDGIPNKGKVLTQISSFCSENSPACRQSSHEHGHQGFSGAFPLPSGGVSPEGAWSSGKHGRSLWSALHGIPLRKRMDGATGAPVRSVGSDSPRV